MTAPVNPTMPPPLETARLILRPFEDRDRDAFAALVADPEVMRFFPAPLDRARSDALIDRLEAHRAAALAAFPALELKATGECIGFAGLHASVMPGTDAPCVEVGWRLARPAWGQGYATEAARADIARGFAPRAEGGLDLAEIVAFAVAANAPSLAVMERLGMTRDPADDFALPDFPPGHPHRAGALYRLRACDFAPDR
ncbi:ribosomal-protein-alanine N-acetyltransferase [Albimonas donghaensis]|uniref:Ribosomal-protein-alanine N-acetyltransferase n=2 Tax=Albimonas donghaensis TaxID=356660 RepID=A0A1H2YJA7_9RHOB|nr:ribosomal-protein-alanine N-acetyltransferase [Albimonas donghaensis]